VSGLVFIALESLRGPLARILLAYGRTPLFTYLLHIYIAHGAALLVGLATGFPAQAFYATLTDPSRLVNLHWGFGLGVVYLVWILVLAALYPLSRWFAEVKRQRREWWLSYI
jgi:hypothetical protein